MEERMHARLAELRRELAQGEQLLAELTGREAELRTSMLRISGAIQVLDELLAADGSRDAITPPGDTAPPDATMPDGRAAPRASAPNGRAAPDATMPDGRAAPDGSAAPDAITPRPADARGAPPPVTTRRDVPPSVATPRVPVG